MSETLKQQILWLIPLAPLCAAVLIALPGPRLLKARSHLFCWAGLGVAFVCSLVLTLHILPSQQSSAPAQAAIAHSGPTSDDSGGHVSGEIAAAKPAITGIGYLWLQVGSVSVRIDLQADMMTAMMLSMVTGVSLLVALFGAGYMRHDPGYPRFFAAVSLFVFSMCMLVLSGSFLMLFVFWEAVGLCSYLLIGFWFQKPSAAAAAKKAFVVNRVGDFGLIAGILLIWQTFGSLAFDDILNQPALLAATGAAHPERITLICLCLFLGAMGKSAQFPLSVWLPDAMEGPTPVSALIHAATMVTAGVYLVARCTPLFVLAPQAQLAVSGIGAVTALIAALTALTQTDLKRVLAYSTVSQLGYMFMALGAAAAGAELATSAVTAGMFHLLTHAFFKALLFLAAGSLMHAMGDVIDMRRFGGLRKALPVTHWTFLCGAAALAGLPLMSGFWSKDDILAVLAEASRHAEYGSFFLTIRFVAIVTALLTAFYAFRAYFRTFHGDERFPEEAGDHPHEATAIMAWPLRILAVLAVGAGLLLGPTHAFASRMQMSGGLQAAESHGLHWGVMAVSTLVAVAGVAAAWWMYVAAPGVPRTFARRMGPLYRLSLNKFYLDEILNGFIVLPIVALSKLAVALDRYLIDGLLDAAGSVPRWIGQWPRLLHNGLLSAYAGVMLIGVVTAVVVVLTCF
ncbi:MAG: NADH-quinone oxidoreductase subunit L [Planctomycetaceae bacterium]